MRTKKEIEQKIAELEQQKVAIITEFNAEQARFQAHAAKQQQTVTHIEGRIIQLQEDLKEVVPADAEAPPLET